MQTLEGEKFIKDEDMARLEKEAETVTFHATGGMNKDQMKEIYESMVTHIGFFHYIKDKSTTKDNKGKGQAAEFTKEEIEKMANEIKKFDEENSK